ncbi:hypothetical protein RF11_03565 [Thelohanellus kitauei]|uniref:Uncharacterized protein n=1 Tax=Thelohanellus kitauei TaxID=669202 RepID=A0A0C2MCY5_THEKT|nr:hypothetical protein RF11_03565 [Thelohanellus kitauei]
MLSLVLLFPASVTLFPSIPRFMDDKITIYHNENQPGEIVLVAFRFPSFRSHYPPSMSMTISREYWHKRKETHSNDNDVTIELNFHSLKCNKTMELSHYGEDKYYTIRPNAEDELHFINDHFRLAPMFVYFKPRKSKSVAVDINIYNFENNRTGTRLSSITLMGWRIHCTDNIPYSMNVQGLLYDPSWNVNLILIEETIIEISILDLGYQSKQISMIRIKNGSMMTQPESDVVLKNLYVKVFQQIDYIWYTCGEYICNLDMDSCGDNILPLFELTKEITGLDDINRIYIPIKRSRQMLDE